MNERHTCQAVGLLLLLVSEWASAQQIYRLTQLAKPESVNSVGSALNDSGQVAGSTTSDFTDYHAYLWDGSAIQDLGTLGGSGSEALAINASGQVTGSSLLAGDSQRHAFLWDGSVMQDLGTLGGPLSEGFVINASGQVTGDASVTSGNEHAFLWDGSAIQDLGTLGGTRSTAIAINDIGQVAGESLLINNSEWHAFLWDGSVMQDLGTLGGSTSFSFAINASGQVTGQSFVTGNLGIHAFLWDGSAMQDLGTLGGSSSRGLAINASGQVTGEAGLVGNQNNHAFLWDGSAIQDLGTLGGSDSAGYAINDSGHVTGYARTINSESHAFLWDGSAMHDLNDLIDPTDPLQPHVTLNNGISINTLGQILANGCDSSSGECHGYLVSPPVAGDTTPPVIQSNVTGTFGNGGWYVSNVQVNWTVTDGESTIATSTGCGSTSLSTNTAGVTYTCSATSGGGTSTDSVTVKRDATAPTTTVSVTPPANASGWRKQTVTVTFSGNDALSGGVTCDPQVVLPAEGAGQNASGRCYDAAGNQSNLATASGINIDKTAPVVSVVTPAHGATYNRNQVVVAAYTCPDTISGTLSCIGTLANGQAINTSKKAPNAKFVVDATDLAGNKTKQSVTYSVK